MSVGLGKSCAGCGAPLGLDAPGGQCPVCLLGLALGGGESSTTTRFKTKPRTNADWNDRPPRYFGDYEIVEEIGRGGMGVIYRARQMSLNRPVAVKMILQGPLAEPGFIERFHIEAEAAAKLNHPNIVPIYEIGEHRGRHFFTMKLVEGGTLAGRMKEFALPRRAPGQSQWPSTAETRAQQRIASMIATVARAVQHAHDRGVLHRDLKPANILLDEGDQPTVTDFGLAKLADEDSLLTQTGGLLGTPAYMAPEQAAGRSGQVTTASDIYSLGAILYHLLAGRPPFEGSGVMEVVRKVCEQDPASPVIENAAIDRDLATITLKCLSKSPADRYPSCRAFADDLDRWKQGETILARPATRTEKFARWCRRNPVPSALIALVALLLVTVAVVSTASAVRIDRAREAAVSAERREAEELWESYLAQARAQRWSGRPGRRFDALRAVTNALAFKSSVALRNEAIAAMALADVAPMPGVPSVSDPSDALGIDWARNRYFEYERRTAALLVRRLADGAVLKTIPGVGDHTLVIGRASDDGRRVILHFENFGGFLVVDTDLGRVELTGGRFDSAVLNPAGSAVAASHTNTLFSLFEVATGAQSTWDSGVENGGLSWSRDGRQIAGFTDRGFFWMAATPGSRAASSELTAPVTCVCWLPDGVRLAVGDNDGGVTLFDTRTRRTTAKLAGHANTVTAMAAHPNGEMLATTGWDVAGVRLWDLTTGLETLHFQAGDEALSFSPDGLEFAAISYRGSVMAMFHIATPVSVRHFGASGPAAGGEQDAMALEVDGAWAATSAALGLTFWNPTNGTVIARIKPTPMGTIMPVMDRSAIFSWTPDGFYLTPTPGRGAPAMARWIPAARPDGPVPPPAFIDGFGRAKAPERGAVSLDGRVAAVTYAERCWIFDMAAGTLQAVTGKQSLMKFVAVSADGRWVATGGWHARNAMVWDGKTGAAVFEAPTETMANVGFSADSRTFVSCTGHEYCFWDTATWKPLRRISRPVHGDLPGLMSFSADGRLMAVTPTQTTIALLRPDTGEEIARIEPAAEGELIHLAMSPDGAYLGATQAGRYPQVWSIREIRRQLRAMGLDWE
jgi:eukaryotic-like serine/threonine-protein kinase